MQTQPTGFIVPQQTALNPFGMQQQQPQGFGGSLQPQATGFLMPQVTGANPFRQSMMFPQSTGIPGTSYGQQQQQQPPPPQMQVPTQTGALNPFPGAGHAFGGQQPLGNTSMFPGFSQTQPQPFNTNPFPNFTNGSSAFASSASSTSQPNGAGTSNPFPSFTAGQPSLASPFAQPGTSSVFSNGPPRSASVPLTGGSSSDPLPVKSHQTGSRNPFGVPVTPAPPVPKAPTLMEIAFGKSIPQQQQQTNGAASPTGLKPNMTGFGSAGGTNGSIIASVASEFAMPSNSNSQSVGPAGNTSFPSFSSSFQRAASPTATGSTATSNSLFSSLSSQPTGATSTASPISPLQPQSTGFSGMKPFKPSSSFGAALLESLPPIPQSAPTTPSVDQNKQHSMSSMGNGPSLNSQPTALNGHSFLNSQPTGFGAGGRIGTGSTVGIGLRPQTTGPGGAANPFRATLYSMSPGPTGNAFGGGLNSTPTGNAFGMGAGGLGSTATAMPSQFGASAGSPFGGPFGASASAPNAFNPQQQQNGHASLI